MSGHPRRRQDDMLEIRVVDTEDGLTLTKSEILELKRLANLSRIARWVTAAVFGAVSLVGFPVVFEWLIKRWK